MTVKDHLNLMARLCRIGQIDLDRSRTASIEVVQSLDYHVSRLKEEAGWDSPQQGAGVGAER